MASRETRKKLGGNNYKRDRISNLPDSILVEILSRLPRRRVLSKRWRPLWTQLHRLSFRFHADDTPTYSVEPLNISLMRHASPRVTHLHIAVDTRFVPIDFDDDHRVDVHSKVFKQQVELLLSFVWRKVFSLDYALDRRPPDFCKHPVPLYL